MAHFEEGYFAKAYGPDYAKRNPPHKWRSFLRVITRFQPRGELLDVGCAYGLFLREATRRYECAGCDISEFAIQKARAHLPADISLFRAAVGGIRVQKNFDVVTCFDVLEHVEDLSAAFENLQSLLKPRGFLVMTLPVYDGPLGWLADRLDRDETHVHRRSRVFWLEQVSHTFDVRYFAGVWRYFLLGRWYLNVVSDLSRWWTTAILIVAQNESS